MQADEGPGGRLCKGLPWRQWDTVLGYGRRQKLSGLCWLETYTESGEIFAVFLGGHVGLLPVSPSLENKCQVHLSPAPAIIELPAGPDPDRCHWVADHADVYFYSQPALLAAVALAPAFGCNFIEILCAQQTKVTETLYDPVSMGVRRLARSLLARAGESGGEEESCAKVAVTQAELAFESGLSRQWVNRLLRGLEKQGVAQVGRGYVVLHSSTTIRAFLQM